VDLVELPLDHGTEDFLPNNEYSLPF